ncbi:NAD(P)-dependent alcohol dehydrogenase [Nonomuraea sp. PA05]|uniref:NAD(P)-dependent alcohol dehydrogenase n=1 Tax=Nonomuraea sp. PA05 TaxID=2604466 RepID=UPI0011D36A5A|nr:NAD(P)-dependent alcohol dehydrogenase [Nonomuraea sp. PA05]TYB61797.1 NAD(P)-dependent alcohol dehydrogenase [Nonomuraea sp. PA05]
MKAAVRARYGPPEVVSVSEVGMPAVKDGDVLVRVRATTVNRTDCAMRAAQPFIWRFFTGLVRPHVPVLGTEFAGDVEAVGDGVTAFKPGDKVFGYNDPGFGAHAEYLVIQQGRTLAPLPEGLTYEEAVPGTEGAHYALSLITSAKVRAGQDVLVYGATGAIGSAAVQLLKDAGANVTAVCGTKHLDLVSRLGADKVVDYTATDFTADEQRYDVVIDAVGKSTFGRCRRLLKPRGGYIASDVGPLWQNLALTAVTPLFGGRRVRFPYPRHDAEMARRLAGLMESGAFRPVIDRHYPLDEIVDAYRYVETGQKTGNVVITI